MISVSYLLSYDYRFFLISVQQLYQYVDRIVVALDIDKKTWSGNSYEIPDSFFDEVRAFDTKNIIEFYFDNFYISDLTPMECESRERNLVLKKLGRGWKIQLDVDEYIYDFKKTAYYLRKYSYLTIFPKLTPVVFKGKLVTLFKKIENGFLYIDNDERFTFITNQSANVHTRNNNHVRNHNSNISVIHQSWAREDNEIILKVKNWGHCDDFDTKSYINFWKELNKENYKTAVNFHPIIPEVWPKLEYIKAASINEFIDKYSSLNEQKIKPISIKILIKALKNKLLK